MARRWVRAQAGQVETRPRRASWSSIQSSGGVGPSAVTPQQAQTASDVPASSATTRPYASVVDERRPRRTTGSPELDRQLAAVLDALPRSGRRERDLRAEIVTTAVLLARDAIDPLDLKITSAALREMRTAFRAYAPYRGQPKVTIFGSARTRPEDPLYAQARAVAEEMAERGWMVVTGAGPGIMAAGMEGAGRERSFGVSIRLPFEQGANSVIASDEKLVSMKYFFTRKLMLIKESQAFVCLPGGFGTLDETFELLTLTQTGKGVPVPIVFLDVPGGTYWKTIATFIDDELVSRGLVSKPDLDLFVVTDDVAAATTEITDFYRNYESIRFVGDDLVVRLRHAPTDEQLAELDERFGHLVVGEGRFERTDALPEEVDDDDALDLERIRFRFAKRGFGELRSLIDALNTWAR